MGEAALGATVVALAATVLAACAVFVGTSALTRRSTVAGVGCAVVVVAAAAVLAPTVVNRHQSFVDSEDRTADLHRVAVRPLPAGHVGRDGARVLRRRGEPGRGLRTHGPSCAPRRPAAPSGCAGRSIHSCARLDRVPADAGAVPNRLASATSPYLLQHADNPVDWVRVGRRGVRGGGAPGTCRCWSRSGTPRATGATSWRTSRSRTPATAAFMNEHFVCVKVDREERPDVDAVYMAATQAMTGSGGWPMTVFTTPTGEPFFCGTYFPPRRVHGMPSFPEVLASVAAAWTTRRDEVEASAADHRRGARRAGRRVGAPAGAVRRHVVDDALAALATTFDAARGGFGGAPKFPPSMVLEWLLRHHARTGDVQALADGGGDARGDGPRRHVRPARRWLRAVLGRRRVGGARTSRRCSTTTRCCCGCTCTRGGRPDRRSRARRRRDRAVAARRAAHGRGRVRVVARRRQRGPRGRVLRLDPRAAADGARGRRRHLGGRASWA